VARFDVEVEGRYLRGRWGRKGERWARRAVFADIEHRRIVGKQREGQRNWRYLSIYAKYHVV